MKARYFTQKDIKKETKAVTRDVISFMLHLVAWYLRDELGWGHDRIERCMNWMDEHAAKYMGSDGEVSLTDLHEMLVSEVGINISFDKERMR